MPEIHQKQTGTYHNENRSILLIFKGLSLLYGFIFNRAVTKQYFSVDSIHHIC